MAIITAQARAELVALYLAMFNKAPSKSTLTEMVDAVESGASSLQVADLLTLEPGYQMAGQTAAEVATYLTGALLPSSTIAGAKAFATTWIVSSLNAGKSKQWVALEAVKALATTTNPDFAAAKAKMESAVKAVVDGVSVGDGQTLVLTESLVGTANVMGLTGDQDVRIDFTANDNQIKGLDLNGNGVIENNGVENNNPTALDDGKDFEIVDAYMRDRLNLTSTSKNFHGDIAFDGTGFSGDGVSTNGNIFLGGLGADTAFGGIGNDFLVGGGVSNNVRLADVNKDGINEVTIVQDALSGGRNADFFFAEFSSLDFSEAESLSIDGGSTSDDAAVGDNTPQDSDWFLIEASDDEEPYTINLGLSETAAAVPAYVNGGGNLVPAVPAVLGGDDLQSVSSAGSESLAKMKEIENVDASGNLYGFVNNVNVALGEGGKVVNGQNVGVGSSAQLNIIGSVANNILIGGYDNDKISGGKGSDLLMGGNLKYALNNPNAVGIVNDGMDELFGGDAADNIVFEADGGVVEGENELNINSDSHDTVWLTNQSHGTKTAADLITDGVLRIDLATGHDGGLGNSAGYGGADVDTKLGYTADQTMYKSESSRVTVQDMESVIATGLGAVDYLAAGTNNPELLFNNQQNHLAYTGNLHLRGTDESNTLYATSGMDVLEGRKGGTITYTGAGVVQSSESSYASGDNRDKLSGGAGRDDFYFELGNGGDGVDVIHRQVDANGDNIWDADAKGNGMFGQDFGLDQSSITQASVLQIKITKVGGNAVGDQLSNVVNFVSEITTGIKLSGGTTFEKLTLSTDAIKAAKTYQGLVDAVNVAIDATAYGADLQASLQADGVTIFITDSKGRELADTSAEVVGAGVTVQQIANTQTENVFQFGQPPAVVVDDRLIYVAYEDRSDNERRDDDAVLGSHISLGVDNYAEDLVVGFNADGTNLAEDQQYNLVFSNLTTQDKVTIMVNGVEYTLQVGVDVEGNSIANEDSSTNTPQATIQANFLVRFEAFINSFMDDDTAAGRVDANETGGNTLQLTQHVYNGEETVFMSIPTVAIQNLSNGEPATISVTNVSEHEVQLYKFDGRDGKLNEKNVLFIGDTGENRSTFETAKNAGSTITGKNAVLIDNSTNDFAATVANATDVIADSKATNALLDAAAQIYSVHGDDLLLGGTGADTIKGGTGDDRVIGSRGTDSLDGGKNYYAVKVLGEPLTRVYELNVWEAANPTKVAALNGLTISSITLVNQSENGTGVVSGLFDDTLQFQQADFEAGKTKFTVTLNDYTVTAGVVELRNGGAGSVETDVDGNGTFEAKSTFTNFENIRTVSGIGQAVAGNGQGDDTLNVNALSKDTGGISYDLTNAATAGEVRYSTDKSINAKAYAAGQAAAALPGATAATVKAAILAIQATSAFAAKVNAISTGVGATTATVLAAVAALPELNRPSSVLDDLTGAEPIPDISDYEALVIKVDGVESVIGGAGNDLLYIDETEAAKNNMFTGNSATETSTDRIEYQNDYGTVTAEPTVTIKVETTADQDQVVMTGGRVGQVVATDTLNRVEYITLAGNTAQGTSENDVIDVTAMVTGAVVDYSTGQVRTGLALDSGVKLVIENIVQMESVYADGNDTVIVADAQVMAGNTREDNGVDATPDQVIQLPTYLDYDDTQLNTVTNKLFRKSFPSQVLDNTASMVVNQNQFTYDLSRVGTDADVDTVDYSKDDGKIVAVMNFTPGDNNKYVLVSGDGDNDFTDAAARVDHLISVERIVAAKGADSTIDLTNSKTDVNIVFSYNQPDAKANFVEGTHKNAALDLQMNTVRVSDASNQAALGNVDLVEYRDLGDSTAIVVQKAVWESVEGGDFREFVQLTQWEDGTNHLFNLRGGQNEVNYNERTNGISLVINSVDTTVGGIANQFSLTVNHLDTNGVAVGSSDTIFGFNTNNTFNEEAGARVDTMRIEASQGDLDFINVAGLNASGIYLLGQIETSGSSVVTATFDGLGQGLTMSGFEYLWDGIKNDTYTINDLTNFASKLTLIDFGQLGAGPNPPSSDRDTIKLANGAFESAVIRPPVAHALTIDANLHMGDAHANDLQWLGVNDNVVREPLGTGGSEGFDFQVLDISEVTATATGGSLANLITAAGSVAGTADELVVGNQALLNSTIATAITNFDILSLTGAGASYDFDLTAGQLQTGANVKIVGFDADMDTLDVSRVTSATTITVTGGAATVVGSAFVDTITGGGGNDVITGGMGADVLSGGIASEVRQIQLDGILSATAQAVTINMDGITFTLNEVLGAPVDVDADLGDNLDITAGAGSDAVGAAFVTLLNANLDEINASGSFGGTDIASISFDAGTDQLTITFVSGVDVLNTDTIVAGSSDTGTFLASTENVTSNGGDGGSDTFVYKAAGQSSSAAMDSITGFNIDTGVGSTDDLIDLAAIDADATIVGDQAFGTVAVDNAIAASTTALNTAATAALGGAVDIFVGRTATDAYVYIDTDQDGSFTGADMIIKLTGVTDVTGVTAGENFVL
jgi:hypothetical protein